MSDIWVAGINVGHNASTCLLKNGEIVFHLEEERLSRRKYDEFPFLGIAKIKEFTEKLDYLAVPWESPVDITQNHFISYAKKLKLIDNFKQVINYDSNVFHHVYHAFGGFYNSGFDEALCFVLDGAGSFLRLSEHQCGGEVESVYKIYGTKSELLHKKLTNTNCVTSTYSPDGKLQFVSSPGIGLMYNALSGALGNCHLEAGKAMGLSSYGKEDNSIPDIFVVIDGVTTPNKNMFFFDTSTPYYYTTPTILNASKYDKQNLAWKIQRATEKYAYELIQKYVNETGIKNVVVSGGYGLNCVANYEYLKLEGINLFVDPPAYDGGLSIGAAKLAYAQVTGSKPSKQSNYYLGPEPTYEYNATGFKEIDATYKDVIDLILSGNIVTLFQGRSEAGPRALGNRSILFDPRLPNGKDIVNEVKNREWYRPFAGTVLKEFANDYFDMRGLEESPFMMFAVNVLEDKKSTIPAITHVDGTCRIQTVTEEQNKHYYNLISEFNKQTGVPILFNTSFNLGGEPIVETINEALQTLRKSKLQYLYLPEISKLLVKDIK